MGLGLDCLGPKALIRRAPMAHRPTEMAPGEREHSDPKGHAGPSAATRPVNSGPRERAVIAIAEGEPLSRVPPARSSAVFARGIEAGWPRREAARFTRARCGEAARAKTKSQESQDEAICDLLANFSPLDPILKHPGSALKFFSAVAITRSHMRTSAGYSR